MKQPDPIGQPLQTWTCGLLILTLFFVWLICALLASRFPDEVLR